MTTAIIPNENMSLAQLEGYREALRETREALSHEIPPNTKVAYDRDFRMFREWCDKVGFKALPTNDEAMTGYATHLAFGMKQKPTTIMRRLYGVAHEHKDKGHESPVTKAVLEHLRQIRRRPEVSNSKKQAPPMLVEDLKVIVKYMNDCPDALRAVAVRDKAMLLLGWNCAMRRSEIVGLSLSDIISRRGARTINIGRSKTDQEGHGIELPLNYAKKHPDLCALRAVDAWLEERGTEPGALFWKISERIERRRLVGGELLRGTAMPWIQVNRMMSWWQILSGYQAPEGRRFSPHSLRAGYITETALAGELPNVIMARSRHKSLSVFNQYIRVALDHATDPTKAVL